ncbi:hypothetical protein GQ457_06G016210 [Hibiscus cannabinus]
MHPSANRRWENVGQDILIFRPLRFEQFNSFSMSHEKTLETKRKGKGDGGSPCLSPLGRRFLFHSPALLSSSDLSTHSRSLLSSSMATLLKTQPFKSPPSPLTPRVTTSNSSKPSHVCFKHRLPRSSRPLLSSFTPSLRFVKLVPFAGDTETTDTQQEVQEPQIEDSSDGWCCCC